MNCAGRLSHFLYNNSIIKYPMGRTLNQQLHFPTSCLYSISAMNILDLSARQLRQAADIKEQIGDLQNQLQSILGGGGNGVPSPARAKKNRMSAAGRLAIIAAQKLRWSKYKGKKTTSTPTKKRTMSAAARAKIAAAARLRWKKVKAVGKKTL